jgi:hypothetical protein
MHEPPLEISSSILRKLGSISLESGADRNEKLKSLIESEYLHAGSCELMCDPSFLCQRPLGHNSQWSSILKSPFRRPNPDHEPHLPFSGDTTMTLVRALDLNLQWLSVRTDNSGTIHAGFANKFGDRRKTLLSPSPIQGSGRLRY